MSTDVCASVVSSSVGVRFEVIALPSSVVSVVNAWACVYDEGVLVCVLCVSVDVACACACV